MRPAAPLTPERVLAEALHILDEQGLEGLHVRALTARLSCSTKTLYQVVGNRHALERGVVAAAFAAMDLQFRPGPDWTASARAWARTLHDQLRARPYLGALMTLEDREATVAYVVRLVDALAGHGLPRRTAVRIAGNLGHWTIATTLLDLRAPGQWDHPERFEETLGWLLDGIAASLDAGSTGAVR